MKKQKKAIQMAKQDQQVPGDTTFLLLRKVELRSRYKPRHRHDPHTHFPPLYVIHINCSDAKAILVYILAFDTELQCNLFIPCHSKKRDLIPVYVFSDATFPSSTSPGDLSSACFTTPSSNTGGTAFDA